MLAVLINGAAILVGGLLGLLLKKGMPEEMGALIMKAIALCVIYIGVSGSLIGENTLILILSMMVGAVIGFLLKLDERLNRLAKKIEDKTKSDKTSSKSNFAEAFVTATLLFCVGALAIVGSLQAGLVGDYEMLFTKSLMDGISSVIFAASLGFGVLFSAIPLVAYQGGIVLISGFVAPYLSDNIINEMTAVGSLLILAIGLNMLGITHIKVMNLMPAVFLPILLCQFI